jgi:hypothetical protein
MHQHCRERKPVALRKLSFVKTVGRVIFAALFFSPEPARPRTCNFWGISLP